MADRNEKGQFVKGHAGGPGRPRRRTEEQYIKATVDSVTLNEWKVIVRKTVYQAKRGDHRARQWLSDYLMGKPEKKLDVTTGGERIIMTWGDNDGN